MKAVRGGGVKRGDVCYGMLRAAACVDESDHHALMYVPWVVYYYRTYEKAVSEGGRGGKRRTCAKGPYQPRPVRSSLATSH